MQDRQRETQQIRRWMAGGLCLLMLWRPLRADGNAFTVAEPLPEAHGEQSPKTEAPQAPVSAPEEPGAVEDKPTPAADAATQTPEQPAGEAPASLPPTAEPPTPAPSAPAAAQAEDAQPPRNAHEDASFSRGYAVILSGGEVRLHAHTRKTSAAVLKVAPGEVVLATGRVAYQATRKERKEQEASGKAFSDWFGDWFAVRARDAEGRIVEGYLPGGMLLPMTAEEVEEMRLGWEEAAKEPNAEVPQLEDGVPLVSGVYAPPELNLEEDGAPGDTEAPEPAATDVPADTGDPEASETPQASGEPSPAEPSGVPGLPDGEEGPADAPSSESAPTQEPASAQEPASDALARAETLIAESESFFAEAETRAALMALGGPDEYPPTILDAQISYSLNGPSVPSAKLSVWAADEQNPAHPDAEISGIAGVYVVGPDGTRQCSYDAASQRFTLVVYHGGAYTIHAVDLAGNESARLLNVDQALLPDTNEKDATPPVVQAVAFSPETDKAVAVEVSVRAEDVAPAGEVASGVAEVWLLTAGNMRIPFELDPDTLEYKGEVFENGAYRLFVKDAAGNVHDQPFDISNILDLDTYPPTITSVLVDPPDEDGHLYPMVQVTVQAEDKKRPKSDERVSGVAKAEIGFFYGMDQQDNIRVVDLEEMYPLSPGVFGYYFEENGAYVIAVTDYAGNRTLRRLDINHVGEEKARKRDPNWEFRPVDDDGDGLYTQTEYRLGSNPANRDTGGDGLWDGLCVRMGFDANGYNASPKPSVLSQAKDASMLEALVAAGTLEAPLAEEKPGVFRHRLRQDWRKQRNNVVWMHPQSNTLLSVNNSALFAASIPRSEVVEIERAISLQLLGYGSVNNGVFRTVAPCGDGSMVLLFDRGVEGGPLTKDAFLIDTLNMTAYRVPDTKGARGLSISEDGAFLAIWRTHSLARVNLRTGETLRIDDPERCARVEMLNFLPDNRLVTRVNSIGYSAILPDGTFEVGNSAAMPCLTQYQDLTGLTLYDRNMSPLRINLQLLLRSTGVFVQGEPPEESAVRNLSPRAIYERSAGVTASR